MAFRPEEVSSIIQNQLEIHDVKLDMESVGSILQIGDGIVRIWGLQDAMASELLMFPGDIMGMVMNLEEDNVGAVLFGPDTNIKEGDTVKRTGKIAQVPAGEALLGRVVNSLGYPIDGKGPIVTDHYMPVEAIVPNVLQRQPVKEPLQTGLKAIDSMIPIGRGQRELIIGDRQTGKTAIAIDTIINKTFRMGSFLYQSKKYRHALYLRGRRTERVHCRTSSQSPRGQRRDGLHHRRQRLGQRTGPPAVSRTVRRMCHG